MELFARFDSRVLRGTLRFAALTRDADAFKAKLLKMRGYRINISFATITSLTCVPCGGGSDGVEREKGRGRSAYHHR